VSERRPRVVVIGAGVAGTAAALAAARSQAKVTVLDGGPGASALSTGAVDRTPWRPEGDGTSGLPPLARYVFDALGAHVLTDRPAQLLTMAGVRRPARGRDAALLDVTSLAGRPLGVVRCTRPGWDAEGLAQAWGGACITIEAIVMRYSDERALPDAEFAARHDDDARLGWLAERLREALAIEFGGDTVAGLVLPPSLGIDRARADQLSGLVGLPCGEPLGMPGGPAGLRFERARDRALGAAGIERVEGRAEGLERTPSPAGGGWRVTLVEGEPLDADAVVLATGGLLGGGIEYAPSEAMLALAVPPRSRAPLRATLDAPVSLGAHGTPLESPGSLYGLPPEEIAWPFASDGLLARAGVLVGEDGGCLGAPVGLFAAGELVADAPRTWLGALVAGATAGVSAARPSGETSPGRGLPTRP
jgi:glycerol-3-phosphate dehydrogenase subunit B